MYESEFKKIIEASQNHSLTFFVGAGVSALSNVPTWKGIIDTISKKMNYEVKDSYSSDEYLRIPQMFYYSIKKNNKEYYNLIQKCLDTTNCQPNEVHKKLLELNPSSFITTNFDDLLEKASVQYCQSFKTIACDSEVPCINGDKFILKVHGDIQHKNIVFKEEDYLNYSENFKLLETLLKSIFSTNTVVFIGYGLNDYNIKLILNWTKTLLADNFNRPIFIYTENESLTAEELSYQQSKGLFVIEYEKLGTRYEEYAPRYLAVIEAIKRVASISYEGKTEEEAFNVTYELLKPLDELNALRIYDITEKLSNSIIISENGRIVSISGHNCAVKYFLKINKLSREDYELLPAEVKEKYELILRVFMKAQVRVVEEDNTIRSLSEEKISFGDPHCIAFDYHKMQTIINGSKNTLQEKYCKAYYLVQLFKYEDAFFLFSRVAKEAFENKNYVLYYMSQINCISLHKIINNLNSFYRCYDIEKINNLMLEGNTESLFEKLPVEFRNQYKSLSNLDSVNLLYKYSYQAFNDGEKLRNAIETNTLELGLTSSSKVVCRINEAVHFLLGNHLVIDKFSEYKNTIKNLMSLLLYKYSTQKNVLLQEHFLPRLDNEIIFDLLDFYCFIEFFEAKEIIKSFSKNHIENIEFQDVESIELAVRNIMNFYEVTLNKKYEAIAVISVERQIKTCLILLRYINISQHLVEDVCEFIFRYNFRDILINDKILFLEYQIARKQKNSLKTAAIIENKLIEYVDAHINALQTENKFEILSSSSGINYCNLVHYIDPHDKTFHSHKLSLRVSKIIKLNLSALFPHIVKHYWGYISTYQKRKVILWAENELARLFRFDFLLLLIECNAKIDKNTIISLKEYLFALVKKASEQKESNVKVFPPQEPYEELIQVGYWCLIKALPPEFSEYVGYSDLFDFYYLYNKFDFNKFQPKWLLNLLPHTLKIISQDKMVRTKIRKSIADMISTTNLMLQDKERLQSILIHYFCQ